METVIRVAIIFVFIMVALRVMGKREFSQLSSLELVSILLIPELASQALVMEDFSVTNALIGLATLFTIVYLNSTLLHLNKKYQAVVAGSPTVLVAHGELIEKNLNLERVSAEEVFGAMHKSGLDQLKQVRWAVLEGDGRISIVPEDQAQRAQRPEAERMAG